MTDTQTFDVAIIGAGPAGSYLAWKLAGTGYRVAVLEEHEVIGEPVNCTGIIGIDCFKKFPLGLNSVRRAANSARFYSPAGHEILLQKEENQAYIIDRGAFDRELAEKAMAAGATYYTGQRIKNILVDSGGVKLFPSDRTNIFEARATVIASGFNSKLPELLGLGRITSYAFGGQVEVSLPSEISVEVYFGNDVAPNFFAWLVPTSEGRGLAGLFSRTKQANCLRRFLNKLYSQGKISGETGKVIFGGVPLGMIPKSYASRVLVVGDAAGQVKPTTGGGIYYGLLCADMAVNTLNKALKQDNLSAKALRDYELKWKAKLGREIRIGQLARNIYHRLSDAQIEKAFEIVQSSGLHNLILEDQNFSFDWQASTILKAMSHQALKSLWTKMSFQRKEGLKMKGFNKVS